MSEYKFTEKVLNEILEAFANSYRFPSRDTLLALAHLMKWTTAQVEERHRQIDAKANGS